MKAVLQRVNSAYVRIDGQTQAEIDKGLLILFGVEKGDEAEKCAELAYKSMNLRIFEDENGKMGRSVKDIDGGVIVVSQFTLAGNCKKGLRPDFTTAMEPVTANLYYEKFVDECRRQYAADRIQTGVFAADMKVGLENDGPVTIILESR
ncbi:D-aminoacyl-tRNA deacylase [Seleniivibrio sp.]|uniref:D-aminoacyl-tRNA deacylase n=1 Tax=Seleniivibrio sp. TaxID=2898801 RepID=UPI002600DDFD|nr:D-aminoacyl-tRNA deacylase [Seleniivibrio sp.]MCD8552975.1 D-tyrosyl-tRNA(Tyr) deacylase [Seleniivibrio sp.]